MRNNFKGDEIMPKAGGLNFRISSALKDIIGRELITDDFIAVFELVKNSFDAHATHAEIIFENFKTPSPRLIITDNGKGMNYADLIDKWLFVAYSAKKEGTEDEDLDYRDKIYTKRVFAGAKGIGRFSCDRLGRTLNLISLKKERNSKIENLFIDWENFEEDSKEEFINIDVKHETLRKIDYNIKHGTVLEIGDLRDKNWSRNKILMLKHSLEKLINPNQENDVRNFSIEIIAEHELENDKEETDIKQKVNSKIRNTIFETLGLKTTQIIVEVSRDGKYITTKLIDREIPIYEIKEKNNYLLLGDIKFHLFYLNFAAKFNFTKLMGVNNVEYGSVFLYKNGFRIYPFGEDGEDNLGIDRRKGQGYARYLGTRELLGRIEINGDNIEFRETSSRDGGLVKTPSYFELIECFKEKCLTRLEKYVVDVIDWGTDIPEGDLSNLREKETKEKILDIISKITRAKNVIDLKYDKKFLNILQVTQEGSLKRILKNFQRIAKETDNKTLLNEANRAEKQIVKLQEAKEEAEKETEEIKKKKKEVDEKLSLTLSQNLFLKSITSQDFDQVVGYLHHIGIYANTINNYILTLLRKIIKGSVINKDILKEYLEKMSLENKKILSFAKFATKSGFKAEEEEIKGNILNFLENYLFNNRELFKKNGLEVKTDFNTKQSFIKNFRPIEVLIIIDNLLNNAKKARAKNVMFHLDEVNKSEISIRVYNDGKPLDEIFKNPEVIFDKGVTTTNGAGLGLHHIKQILKKLNGSIKVNKLKKGIEFIITIKK